VRCVEGIAGSGRFGAGDTWMGADRGTHSAERAVGGVTGALGHGGGCVEVVEVVEEQVQVRE
jgi:hypothetical protein